MVAISETVPWEDIDIACIIDEPGTSKHYKTGSWRTLTPKIDYSKCNKCGMCFVYCPDMAIREREDGYFEVDLEYCKGCGICVKECKAGAITMNGKL